MASYEYLWLCIPDDVIKHYQLQKKDTNDGYIHVKIKKGMYGLPQRLKQHSYYQSHITPGLRLHKQQKVQFVSLMTILVSNIPINKIPNNFKQYLHNTMRCQLIGQDENMLDSH